MKKAIASLITAASLFATPAIAGIYDDILRAANLNDTTTVVDLLRRGMDVNTADSQGNTLMMIAVREKNLELVRFLLENRANSQRRNRYGDTAMMVAALQGSEDIVRLMLEKKVNPNQTDWNALHYAAFENRDKVVALLLAGGADVNAPAPNGSTPLMLAAKRGHLETVRLLVGANADINHIDLDEGTALDMARKAGHHDIYDFLRNAGGR